MREVSLHNRINLLAPEAKVLAVGLTDQKLTAILETCCANVELLRWSDDVLEILNRSLYDQYDVILFWFSPNHTEFDFPPDAIVIIPRGLSLQDFDCANDVQAILTPPVTESQLLQKIFAALVQKEADRLIARKQIGPPVSLNDAEQLELERYLDRHSGSVMFLNDDLDSHVERLRNLEISHELFTAIASNLTNLTTIFSQQQQLSELSAFFTDFARLLVDLDITRIEPARYAAFDLLTGILEDITTSIHQLFVTKTIKDIRVFEYSLQSNIAFFSETLVGRCHKQAGALEFFDD